ncbi:MAG: hypothetical protein WC637_22885, partial [Victivallales bacterium]
MADLSAAGGIHKNLSPSGLRIFLAQRRMFFSRRIYSIRLPPPLGSYGGTGRSEILFELSKIFRPPRSLSDLEMGVTAGDFACSSACLRVILGFQVPKRTLEHELLPA